MASKTAKKANDNISFDASFTTIKKAAKVINDQVSKSAGEIRADLYANGEQLVDITTKTVKETIAKIDINEGVNTVKKTAQQVNEFALETAEQVVDGMLTNGKGWQDVTEKAVNGGLKLVSKQQDIMFDTLEDMKGQVAKGAKRFTKLFKAN